MFTVVKVKSVKHNEIVQTKLAFIIDEVHYPASVNSAMLEMPNFLYRVTNVKAPQHRQDLSVSQTGMGRTSHAISEVQYPCLKQL